MEQRDKLSAKQHFQFLLTKESREEEWQLILRRFEFSKVEILEGFLSIHDEPDLYEVVATLIEDSFQYFYEVPGFEDALKACLLIPREDQTIGLRTDFHGD